MVKLSSFKTLPIYFAGASESTVCLQPHSQSHRDIDVTPKLKHHIAAINTFYLEELLSCSSAHTG